ncbi:tRNA lysidine(34) synthetase TilS [Candidatus Saccharibacteria bacterium]|nr:tRNA lysidine(34) synthetase TilS [Candidatus Saccharibacteria bacterium]
MKKTFVIAVSGGVDSMALLHKLSSVKPQNIEYIVAHFDHGIRSDSHEDAAFVAAVTKSLNYSFELGKASLGEKASEEVARTARYDFLYSVMKKYKAEGVITAHHQDDVLETMVINMLRGTGPKGLIGFTRAHIIRPFMNKTKQDVLSYATEHELEWREDSTNTDESYLRNYVRAQLVPKLGGVREKLLIIRESVGDLYLEIDDLTKKLLVSSLRKGELVRSRFVTLPVTIQHELIAAWLRLHEVTFDAKTITRIALAIKTLEPGKRIDITNGASLEMKKETIHLNIEG